LCRATDSRPAFHLAEDNEINIYNLRHAWMDVKAHKWNKEPIVVRQRGTCLVGVLCHPGDGDASDLGVAESQQEGAVGFGHQHVLSLLLVHEAEDGPRQHTNAHRLVLLVTPILKESYSQNNNVFQKRRELHLAVGLFGSNTKSILLSSDDNRFLPVIPVRLEMFLHELHDSIKPLPEGKVSSR